jgi:ABC transporter substrate binding protein
LRALAARLFGRWWRARSKLEHRWSDGSAWGQSGATSNTMHSSAVLPRPVLLRVKTCQNLVFERSSVNFQLDRLPAIAAEFVRRRVNVIGATTLAATIAAKAATQTMPIVFVMGPNPVERGIVPSLARPGGNITGVTDINVELIAKRLEILHELVPSASLVSSR